MEWRRPSELGRQEISLQGEAGVGATGAGGVIVDHASLIRTVHQLARRADGLWCARDDEAERRNGPITRQHEKVAGPDFVPWARVSSIKQACAEVAVAQGFAPPMVVNCAGKPISG